MRVQARADGLAAQGQRVHGAQRVEDGLVAQILPQRQRRGVLQVRTAMGPKPSDSVRVVCMAGLSA